MDNPKIVGEISDMVRSEKSEPAENTATSSPAKKEVVAAPAPSAENQKAKSRKDLLYALKPYLSEKRGNAIDSMLSVAEVFTMLKR